MAQIQERRSKRASYRHAIDWIAQMDSAGDDDALDADVVSYLLTACLVADVFGMPSDKVGRDIVARRKALNSKAVVA